MTPTSEAAAADRKGGAIKSNVRVGTLWEGGRRSPDTCREVRRGGVYFLPAEHRLQPAKKIMERIRRKVEHMAVRLSGEKVIRITVSTGIAGLDADRAVGANLIDADRALYTAQESARNRVEVRNFHSDMLWRRIGELNDEHRSLHRRSGRRDVA